MVADAKQDSVLQAPEASQQVSLLYKVIAHFNVQARIGAERSSLDGYAFIFYQKLNNVKPIRIDRMGEQRRSGWYTALLHQIAHLYPVGPKMI